jgi:hypothetical protein
MALSGDDVCELVALVEQLADSYGGEYGVDGAATLAWGLGYDPTRLALIERARLDCAARRSPVHPGVSD